MGHALADLVHGLDDLIEGYHLFESCQGKVGRGDRIGRRHDVLSKAGDLDPVGYRITDHPEGVLKSHRSGGQSLVRLPSQHRHQTCRSHGRPCSALGLTSAYLRGKRAPGSDEHSHKAGGHEGAGQFCLGGAVGVAGTEDSGRQSPTRSGGGRRDHHAHGALHLHDG